MLNRISYGAVAILALVTVVATDAFIASTTEPDARFAALLRHGSVMPVFFSLVMVVGVAELTRLLGLLGHRPSVVWASLMCVVLMLSPWLCAGGVLGSSPVDVEGLHWQVIWLLVAVLGTMVVHLRRGVSQQAMADLGATLLTIVYLGFLPSFAVQMRCDANIGDPIAGAWTVLIILGMVFASDIGALYVGKAIGSTRLAPSISPGKTVEGLIGGVVGSVVLAAGVWAASSIVPPDREISTVGDHLAVLAYEATRVVARLTFAQMFGLAAAVSLASQVGDLFESLIKRSAQVKDSSQLIPGMGGVLDVLDGAVFAVPLAWLLLTRVWQVV